MLSSGLRRTFRDISYILLVLGTFCALLLSCVALLGQAVRTAPNRSWSNNLNALIIGASYVFVLVVSLLFCVKRVIAVRLRLQRISRPHNKLIGRGDVPNAVHQYMTQEYVRTCLVAFQSEPKEVVHEGWGRPGTRWEGIRFRQALLDTIPEIDALVHLVIPTHPMLKPHDRMLHHFRFILPLLTSDEDELTPLHYYDSAIQLARLSHREPTEHEFEFGMEMAEAIKQILNECRLEMLEGSSTQLNAVSDETHSLPSQTVHG